MLIILTPVGIGFVDGELIIQSGFFPSACAHLYSKRLSALKISSVFALEHLSLQ